MLRAIQRHLTEQSELKQYSDCIKILPHANNNRVVYADRVHALDGGPEKIFSALDLSDIPDYRKYEIDDEEMGLEGNERPVKVALAFWKAFFDREGVNITAAQEAELLSHLTGWKQNSLEKSLSLFRKDGVPMRYKANVRNVNSLLKKCGIDVEITE